MNRIGVAVALCLFSLCVRAEESTSNPVHVPGHFKDGSRFNLACQGDFDVPPSVLKLARPAVPSELLSPRAYEDMIVRRYEMVWNVKTYFDVGVDGRPTNIRSDRTEPRGFGKSANATMKLWRFSPATRAGQPVKASCAQEFGFDLRTTKQKAEADGRATE